MTLRQAINSPLDVKIPAAFSIEPRTFSNMWTYSLGRVSNNEVIEEIRKRWQAQLGSEYQVNILYVEIATKGLFLVEDKTKVVRPIRPEDLFNSDIPMSQLAASRAQILIVATSAGDAESFNPSLSITITEKGVFVCYGLFSPNTGLLILDKSQVLNSKKVGKSLENILEGLSSVFDKTKNNNFLIEQIDKIAGLRNVLISRAQFDRFLGQLFAKIEYANAMRLGRRISELSNDEKNLDLNSRQLAKIAVNSCLAAWNDSASLLDIISWGTSSMRAINGTEIPNISSSISAWCSLVANYPFDSLLTASPGGRRG